MTFVCSTFIFGLFSVSTAIAYPPEPNRGPAPPPVEDRTELTLSRIYQSDDFQLDRTSLKWDPKSDALIQKEKDDDGLIRIIRRELSSSDPTSTPDASSTTTIPAGPAGAFESFEFSADQRLLLVKTRSQRVWRHRSLAEHWLFNLPSQTWRAIAGGQPIQFATFSANAEQIAFVRAGGLFVEDVQTGQTQAVADSDQANLIHGAFDWVYEEELGLQKGFQFNEKGTKLAFWQIDTSGVPQQTMIDNTSQRYPLLKQFAYPKVGQVNSAVRIGVFDLSTKHTTWIKINGNPREHYLAALQWLDSEADDDNSGERLLIQQLNRRQNENRLWIANPATGDANVLLTETSPGWLMHQAELHRIPNRLPSQDSETSSVVAEKGQTLDLIWQSERSGWNHLYRLSINPSLTDASLTPITGGDWDVIEIDHVDPTNGRVCFTASPKNPTTRGLYSIETNVDLLTTSPSRISPDRAGTFQYRISPSGGHAIETWSDHQTPPVKRLVNLHPYKVIETIDDNQRTRDALAELPAIRHEFVRLAIDDEVSLDAWIMMPATVDTEASIPLLLHVYGEPAGQTVRDVYGGNGYLWNRLMVQNGFAVASVDNRGTASPRGRGFRQAVYGKIGILPPAEQAAGARQLLNRYPGLDASRVGIWGWSGGGSSTLHGIFRYPDLFRSAVAVAPVSDQLDYDTIYQERYMGLYDDDRKQLSQKRFVEGSPITHAKNLQGSLLIIHGTGDDNVHYASTERLINELIAEGKSFEMMAYPGRSHAISEGSGTVVHLRRKMTEFLLRTLGSD